MFGIYFCRYQQLFTKTRVECFASLFPGKFRTCINILEPEPLFCGTNSTGMTKLSKTRKNKHPKIPPQTKPVQKSIWRTSFPGNPHNKQMTHASIVFYSNQTVCRCCLSAASRPFVHFDFVVWLIVFTTSSIPVNFPRLCCGWKWDKTRERERGKGVATLPRFPGTRRDPDWHACCYFGLVRRWKLISK